MRTSQFPIITKKEIPADAEIISHQLMLRSGMIRKLAAGIYNWLPLGLRVLRKVEQIVRDEMNAVGAIEILMPSVQPAELWIESGRWEEYGPELLRLADRHQREFCYGPTHEEVVTDIVRKEIRSYKQLPLTLYQIQTKFRDEIRPRFGVMRAREFIMKDAYSFHLDDQSLQQTYESMFDAYCRIFEHLGLKFRPVEADSGAIGGKRSHEFHVLADSGEDEIVFSDQGDYAANIEQAPAAGPGQPAAPTQAMQRIDTPGQHSIEEVCRFLQLSPAACLKTLILTDRSQQLFAVALRGDHELNLVKAQKLPGIEAPVQLAGAEQVQQAVGCQPGSVGPVGLSLPLYVDHAAAQLSDFTCGANQDGQHLSGCNWQRDLPLTETFDLRNVTAGEPSPDGKGRLHIARGIEVGHIFQLQQRYSEKLKAGVLDENGKSVTLTMGCYGIGISRIVAAAIEQNHDDKGIIWPEAIAPFQIALLPLNLHKSHRVRNAAEQLYQQLVDHGFDVLFEDTKVRPGVMFATMELIGIPHRIVIAERGLDKNHYEYQGRRDPEATEVETGKIIEFIASKVKKEKSTGFET